jgi:hypothetical protein
MNKKFLNAIVNKWTGVNKIQKRIHGIKGSQYRRAEKNEQEFVISLQVETDTRGVRMGGNRRKDNAV